MLDKDGNLTGAGNAPNDASKKFEALSSQAERCRRLAGSTYSREISEMLSNMADDYERTAAGLRADNDR